MKNMNDQFLLSTKQTAELLGFAPNTIRIWRRQNKIPYVRLGKLFKFDLFDLMDFVKSRKVNVIGE
jgi:excisionase family DNA binding protein